MLIWAGCFENRNIFDFKALEVNGESQLSFILQHSYDETDKGAGYILDQHYETVRRVSVTNDLSAFNIHEFNVLPRSKDQGEDQGEDRDKGRALACAYRSEYVSLGDLGRPDEYGWVQPGGFVELDIATGDVLFEWSSVGHIALHESVKVNPWDGPSEQPGWDFLHVNSVDKNDAGDYLLSARFTNTIYLISGRDGHIIWRLGGKTSDFTQDFTFSKQHHAHFLRRDLDATNSTVITFLNNASDELEQEEDVSSALMVEVDVRSKSARVLRRYPRPDGGLTRLRGSVQPLPNENVFVGWSEGGYMSEHAADGRVLLEARFISDRLSTYRAYKFPFVGRPSAPPVLVSAIQDTDTVFHVSWNGATDVHEWRFLRHSGSVTGESVTREATDAREVSTARKADFETVHMARGYFGYVSVEALDVDGNVLGKSDVQVSSGWGPDMVQSQVEGEIQEEEANEAAQEAQEAEAKEEAEAEAKAEAEATAKAKAFEMIRGVGGLLILLSGGVSIGFAVAWPWFQTYRYRRVQQEDIE